MAENKRAAKHIIEMLRLAKIFDASHLCVIWGVQPSTQVSLHPDGSSPCEQDGLVDAPARVLVYCNKRTVQCTMQRPAEHCAACNCETAQKCKICHHQVAYLLQCSLDADAAECLIYKCWDCALAWSVAVQKATSLCYGQICLLSSLLSYCLLSYCCSPQQFRCSCSISCARSSGKAELAESLLASAAQHLSGHGSRS
jgi:hypothetical protein